MKKIYLIAFLLLLSGCNSLRCSFVHPDNMSEAMLEFCKASFHAQDRD